MAKQDRRIARTRAAIDVAVGDLLLGAGSPRIAEIIERADIGRSTFYDHFSSVDHAVLHTLARPLGLLADGIVGTTMPAQLNQLLGHFWEHRRAGRRLLWGATGQQLSQLLRELIEARLSASDGSWSLRPRLLAAQLAEGALGVLKVWIVGEASASPEQMAAAICRTGQSTIAPIVDDPKHG